jgi:hypothetical protein
VTLVGGIIASIEVKAVIPSKSTQVATIRQDDKSYRLRNCIEPLL